MVTTIRERIVRASTCEALAANTAQLMKRSPRRVSTFNVGEAGSARVRLGGGATSTSELLNDTLCLDRFDEVRRGGVGIATIAVCADMTPEGWGCERPEA